MRETMGMIIKRLRKERNYTQEELAEQIGVTSQAVSKWENDAGMPDISQVVPLSTVFGVSTDVLFGRYGINDDEEVERIIKEAEAPLRSDNDYTDEDCYKALSKALKTYPNNIKLLTTTLGYGCTIATEYIHSDIEYAKIIFNECIRAAELIINYSKDISNVLNAHEKMVWLYCGFGQFDKAREHSAQFPKQITTRSMQEAWINRAEKNTDEEIKNRCNIFAGLLRNIEFELRPLGDAYKRKGQYSDAIAVYKTILNIVNAVYGDEEYTPPMHVLAWVHFGLAHCSVLLGNYDDAISWLEAELEFNLKIAKHYNKVDRINVPALRECEFKFFSDHYHIKEDLLEEFNYSCYDVLKSYPRYQELIEKVNQLPC